MDQPLRGTLGAHPPARRAQRGLFRGVLGLDDEAYAALAADGHLSQDYLKADGEPY